MAIQLSEYPARHLDIANKPVIISVTRLLAEGNAGNVIPAEADVSGTIRSFENIAQGENGEPSLKEKLDQLVSRMAAEATADYDWAIRPGAPATRNDPALFEQIMPPLARVGERTKAALAAAKARGVKLGNPNGARALRGKQVGNADAVARIKQNAAQRAADLKGIVDDIRGSGITTVRGIAEELHARGIKAPRGDVWHATAVSRLLTRLNGTAERA